MYFHLGWDISPLEEKHGYAHETIHAIEKIESKETFKHSNAQCSQPSTKNNIKLKNGGKYPKKRKPSQKKTIENLVVAPIFNIYGKFCRFKKQLL